MNLVRTPIDIIKECIISDNLSINKQLVDVIKVLYQYELFKPIMDLTTTLALQKRLKLLAIPKEFYVLDEGNCVTIEGGTFDKISNVFRTNKNYKITIKKVTADVVIHEICHMLEKECSLNLNELFMQSMLADISTFKSKNVSLNSAIKQVMIDEVKAYTKAHQASELFTRYFQLLAMAKEVMGYGATYGYKLEDVFNAFPNFNKWLQTYFNDNVLKKIDAQVSINSKVYIVALSNIKHEWSKEKIHSFHQTTINRPNSNPSSKWSSSVKSIKD